MIWKLTICILLLSVIALSGASLYFYTNPRDISEIRNNFKNIYSSEKNNIDIEFEKLSKIEKVETPNQDLYITGWIPEWGISSGLTTLSENNGLFNSISPIWFFLNPDGTLKLTPQTNGENQIKYFKENSIELIPSIQEFDANNLSKILNDPNSTSKLIDEITEQAIVNNYAGIDLDIESTKLQDKELLYNFLKSLSQKLKESNKKLVFTALAKYTDQFYKSSLQQTLRVQDYARIGSIVDEFRLMTYEFTSPSDSQIGPVQPLEWQEQVIRYAISVGVPRDKLVLGVATYSYDWTLRDFIKELNLKGDQNQSTTYDSLDPAVSLLNVDVDKIKTKYEYTEEFNEAWGEMILKYTFKEEPRVVVYPNNDSILARKKLASEYGIKGIAYWKLGGESGLKL